MLIDLYVEENSNSEKVSLNDLAIEAIREKGLQALVLVGDHSLPNIDPENLATLKGANIKLFAGAVITVEDARFWLLPPTADSVIPEDLGDDPDATAKSLSDAGWAVLLCNPYARELPGGELRDRAVYLTNIHGVLSLTASAEFHESMLAQELAMTRQITAAAGTGATLEHPGFGFYFTLAIPEIESQEQLVEAIRNGSVLPAESTSDRFPVVESAAPPKTDRGGGRGDRGRDGRRGRDNSRGRDRRPRNEHDGSENSQHVSE